MGIIGRVKTENPIASIKHRVKNPCTNGKQYKELKKAHTKTLGEAGLNKPRSPLG